MRRPVALYSDCGANRAELSQTHFQKIELTPPRSMSGAKTDEVKILAPAGYVLDDEEGFGVPGLQKRSYGSLHRFHFP